MQKIFKVPIITVENQILHQPEEEFIRLRLPYLQNLIEEKRVFGIILKENCQDICSILTSDEFGAMPRKVDVKNFDAKMNS